MSTPPPSAENVWWWQTTTAVETQALGSAIGKYLQPGMILALYGTLGAGKTALTKGIAAGLGITATVTSPTFVFVNEYATPAGLALIHMDSYRLGEAPNEAALEAFTLGLDEILSRDDVIVVIEWAELVQAFLPADHLQITLRYSEEAPNLREIIGFAHGPVSAACLAAIPHQFDV